MPEVRSFLCPCDCCLGVNSFCYNFTSIITCFPFITTPSVMDSSFLNVHYGHMYWFMFTLLMDHSPITYAFRSCKGVLFIVACYILYIVMHVRMCVAT